MKISGFTLIRNGTKFDYPFIESLRSLLPLVDELVINVGESSPNDYPNSYDNTLEKIETFAQTEGKGKTHWFKNKWPLDNPEKKKGGCILSEQTNLALDRCTGDWCFYLQADEVLHEEDYGLIREALKTAHFRPEIEGLLFDYTHFYGSFDVVQYSRSSYRREVRVVRRSSEIRSIGDAQSFRKRNGNKLKVTHTKARVFHYGWVRPPEVMKEKTLFFDQLYHGNGPGTGDNYKYKRILGLKPFNGTHPKVMYNRVKNGNRTWDYKKERLAWKPRDLKKLFLNAIESFTGHRFFEYKSYRLLKNKTLKQN